MIKYQEILNKNLLNVFIDILKDVEKKGLSGNNHLYITFATNKIDKTNIVLIFFIYCSVFLENFHVP